MEKIVQVLLFGHVFYGTFFMSVVVMFRYRYLTLTEVVGYVLVTGIMSLIFLILTAYEIKKYKNLIKGECKN